MSMSNWKKISQVTMCAQGTMKHTTYSFSSVSWATSGTVIVPLTSSSSFVLPNRFRKVKMIDWMEHTRILNNKFNIKDGDDLAFTLANIHVPIQANQLVQLSGDAIFLGFQPF